MNTILAFDIETIPDINGIRSIYDISEDICDKDVLSFFYQKRRAKTGNDFVPLHLQKIIVVSCCMRLQNGTIRIGSIGDNPNYGEDKIISKFFDVIEKQTPQIISWNGVGFDLPVLHYRSLIYGINAAKYWNMEDKDFKYNNYINRYHLRHCDLMDLLSLYQGSSRVSLDEISKLCGFPGKLGMDGSKVLDAYLDGKFQDISNYCQTDAVNTFLMFLRFNLVRGIINADEYSNEINSIYRFIKEKNEPHWDEFCNHWVL